MPPSPLSKETFDFQINFIKIFLRKANHKNVSAGKANMLMAFILFWSESGMSRITLTRQITSFSTFFRTTLFSCYSLQSTPRNLYSLSPGSSIITSSDIRRPTSFSTRYPLANEMILVFLAVTDKPTSGIILCVNASLIPCCPSEMKWS